MDKASPVTAAMRLGAASRRRPWLKSRATTITSAFKICRGQCQRLYIHQTQGANAKYRPNIPFLSVPSTATNSRFYASDRSRRFKHEAKLLARYMVTFWGAIACVGVIWYFVKDEQLERRFPTPHEWSFLSRKLFREASEASNPTDGVTNWGMAMLMSGEVVSRLENATQDGQKTADLPTRSDPARPLPTKDKANLFDFTSHDISANSEEWRRGYFEAIMLAAKCAEHVDGWVRDVTRNYVTAPEYVIGPSNPHPTPVQPGQKPAPREEDCVIAFPAADSWYMKILATKGLTPRQKMEAALEYASFMEYKQRPEGSEALYSLALAEATRGMDASKLPYDTKTFVLRPNVAPSLNLLDTLTAIATHKARMGDVSSALPIYISILKARRSLPNEPPPRLSAGPGSSLAKSKPVPFYREIINMFAQPDYPAPPPDGDLPPWRSAHERCEEASLNLYIGEILYATSSRDDGLAWTRDGVDAAEEQLRKLASGKRTREQEAAQKTCRECLSTGLGNWAVMVARLAREEQQRREKGASSSSSNVFTFWKGSQEAEDRWKAEEGVVKERARRTKELLEDITAPSFSISSIFKA